MPLAHLNIQDVGAGRFNAQPVYLCCERGLMEHGCVHAPRGLVFDTDSPAHIAVAMLMKHLNTLGKNVTEQQTTEGLLLVDGEGKLMERPHRKGKKRRVRGLV